MSHDSMELPTWRFHDGRSRLFRRLGGDVAAGMLSSALVAPSIVVIDRALVEKASFPKSSLVRSLSTHTLSFFSRPFRFFKSTPFFLVWALYAGTYCTANTAETLTRSIRCRIDQATAKTLVFALTFAVNVPLGVLKDVRFAQIYGYGEGPEPRKGLAKVPNSPTARGVPRSAIATFLLRDALTIFGSFTLPRWVSAAIPDSISKDSHTKATISQLAVPAVSQIFATPVHLLGLDLYNRQRPGLASERMLRIRRDLLSGTVIRCCRIVPAFGIGCVTNTELRSYFHGK